MTTRLYEFGSAAAGLQFTITATTNAEGTHTDFTVNVLTGSLNLNAVYWSNGDATNDDVSGVDLIGFTGKSSENSLNMNGSGEVWDGGIKLSDAGLGKVPPATYLHAGDTYTFGADIDLGLFDTLGVRATSTSTAEGSIKWVDDCPTLPPVDHKGALLWEENFDNYNVNPMADTWGTVNLTDRYQMDGHAWATKDGNGGWLPVTGEVVKGNAFPDSIASTSGEYWLDTQNSPGGINIANWFHDDTGGKFVLSFDMGTHDFGSGPMQETAANASFEVRVDGQTIKTITTGDFAQHDVMQHFELEVNVGNGDAAGNHLIEFVDTTPQADGGNYVGFALDTIQIHDWVV